MTKRDRHVIDFTGYQAWPQTCNRIFPKGLVLMAVL